MAFELVETTQVFARMAAKIEPEWLLEVAPHLLKKSYADPHWSEKSARAAVKEQATLFGLPVLDRTVDYASVAPAEARLMFLEHALVRGEYRTRGAFQERNREIFAEVARLRDKARRSDMIADDGALLAFFDRRVPAEVVNGKTFEAWREGAEKDDPGALVLTLEDVLAGDPGLVPADYPDTVPLHGATLPLTYRFDPSADDDGVTLTVPLVLLPQIDPRELDWTIPGWHREKIAALLHELPKATRRELGSIPELSEVLASALAPFSGPMIPALAGALATACGVDVPEDAFRTDGVGLYLRLTCRILGEDGQVVGHSKDIADLWGQHGARARAAWKDAAPAPSWERKGVTTWDFGELPPFIARQVSGAEVRTYPALVDRGTSVDLALLESSGAAEAATRAGLRRLLTLSGAARAAISAIAPRIPAPVARPSGASPSRVESDTFRAMVLARIVDEAFRLGEDALPALEARVRGAHRRRHAARRHDVQALRGRPRPRLVGSRRHLAGSPQRGEAPRRQERSRRDPRSARAALPGGPRRDRASGSSGATAALPAGRPGSARTRHRRSRQGRREARDHRAPVDRLPREADDRPRPRERAVAPVVVRGAPGRGVRPGAQDAGAGVRGQDGGRRVVSAVVTRTREPHAYILGTASTERTPMSSEPKPRSMSTSIRLAMAGRTASSRPRAVSIMRRASLRAIVSSKVGV